MKNNLNKPPQTFSVGGQMIGGSFPTYFIADIAANHNGSLDEAKRLIDAAKLAGADAAKFQHFRAEHIVSAEGFRSISGKLGHQAQWNKPVVQVYDDASLPWEWTVELKEHCDQVGLHFFSAPYDLGAINMLDPHVPAYKIGSGDLNWNESIDLIASKGKPVFLATGASTMDEVHSTVSRLLAKTSEICLMQCNTNYSGDLDNFRHIHLNVLKTYRVAFPQLVLGLSDHTSEHATVLGAVTLGARAIEKHFTRDRNQCGPDHAFSMEPADWQTMVDRTRELEAALGSEKKFIADNELETSIVQRRCCRASQRLPAGHRIHRKDINILRPMQANAIPPPDIDRLTGSITKREIEKGEALSWDDLID